MGVRQAETLFREFSRWGFDERGWAAYTRRQYVNQVRRADAWCREHTPRSLFSARDQDLRAWLFQLPPSAHSRNHAAQALKGFFDFLVTSGFREDNPSASIRTVTIPRPLPRALDDEQIRAVLGAAHVFGPMIEAMVNLYVYTALRHSEVRCLEWSAWSGEWLRVHIPKQHKERDVPLHPTARHFLELWRGVSDSDRYVFPSPVNVNRPVSMTWVGKTVREVGEMAGVTGLHPHRFRHSLATHMVSGGIDIRVVQDALGHESLRSTQVYAAVRPVLLKETMQTTRF